jgi:tetratricopeptide (TPR) repeat protein
VKTAQSGGLSDATKAVFLSYAREDTVAAHRIAEVLRSHGIEVWFDQSELRGGDAWDAKIRRQIKECALFMPVISARTQERSEGYFRLEWKLAVDRTHLMAEGVPFLAPVVLDDTPDARAVVPAEFMRVQWTRLPGALPTPQFVEQVKRLLESPGKTEMEVRSSATTPARGSPRKSVPGWAWALAGIAICAAAAAWYGLRPRGTEPVPPPPTASAVSESGALVARARAIYEKWDFATPGDFATADQLLKRALELDPNDGAAWTSYAIMSCGMLIFNFDDRDARLPIALDAAQRAVSLAPDSDYAQFAQALSFRFQPATQEESLSRLRALAARCPTDKFIVRNAGACLRMLGHPEEAIPYFDRAAALPGGDPIAWYNRGLALAYLNRWDEAETAVDQALALEPAYGHARTYKAIFLCSRGDLTAAQLEIGRVPAAFIVGDEATTRVFLVWEWSRRADKALGAIAGDSHPYFRSNVFVGPKAYLAGLAYRLDGRTAAAQAEWGAALQLIDQRLAASPNSQVDLGWQARLRALLGDRAGAETSLQLYQQMGGDTPAGPNATLESISTLASLQPTNVDIYVTLGHYDKALDAIAAAPKWSKWSLFGYLHFSPELDPMRENPRFKALLAQVDALNPDAAARLREAGK